MIGLCRIHLLIQRQLDGLEAVNKINEGSRYDLILMDIIMPNLDGVSACHLIRQVDQTPIIAMTSNIRSDDISMYFNHGMWGNLNGFPQLMFHRHERCLAKTIYQGRTLDDVGKTPGPLEKDARRF